MMKKTAAVLCVILSISLITGCGSLVRLAESKVGEVLGKTQKKTEAETETETKAETEASAVEDEESEEAMEYEVASETKAPAKDDGIVISNALFSITLAEEAEGLYDADIEDTVISIFDKEAREDGYGGFAFAVAAYREPSDYNGEFSTKVGEFTDSSGKLYDVVTHYPSDVQFNYEKYSDGTPESYRILYEAGDEAVKSIRPVEAKGKFVVGGGMKGEDLYGAVVMKYKKAIKEGWDQEHFSDENMSSIFALLGNKAGYAYLDLNSDGIEELLVGEIAEGERKGMVYDIYTMVNRKPAQVVSGWDRNYYYVLEYGGLVNIYSYSALEAEWDTYYLATNSTDIWIQSRVKYDEFSDEKNPWFRAFGDEDEWEKISEKEFDERTEQDYIRFDFTPLSE